MTKKQTYTIRVAFIVALGGFLMGFDASVISGVVNFIVTEFDLTEVELGWSVSSLTLTATLAMMTAGPLSDKYGRKAILQIAAVLYALSAIASAFAPNFTFLIFARMLGGLGVGASLILAPMYIAEIAPPQMRGRMVSFNQLNIVIGLSAAFFSNYLVLKLGQSDASWAVALKFDAYNWRWMLGLETLPAIIYFLGMFLVPKSPRWQVMKGMEEKAKVTFHKVISPEETLQQIADIKKALQSNDTEKATFIDLFKPAMKLVLTIGIVVAILQQIVGINAVFFYSPMIFEQTGIGTDASFVQAIIVGLTNLLFTVLAILFIDNLGRKPLLTFGMAGMALAMFLLAFGFNTATYTLTQDSAQKIEAIDATLLEPVYGKTFDSDVAFKTALKEAIGESEAKRLESQLISASITMNPYLILIGIIGFVASFAFSIGPVMWVLFSELFPLKLKGLAISFAGLINSAVSFLVQLVFPLELATLGSSLTFFIYGLFAVIGFVFVLTVIPETKGKSLEELEEMLIKK